MKLKAKWCKEECLKFKGMPSKWGMDYWLAGFDFAKAQYQKELMKNPTHWIGMGYHIEIAEDIKTLGEDECPQ